jgi:hypothetical protein
MERQSCERSKQNWEYNFEINIMNHCERVDWFYLFRVGYCTGFLALKSVWNILSQGI